MNREQGVTCRIQQILAGIFVLICAYGLKDYYSEADSETLGWLLAPTARLVEWCSGIVFVREAGSGWVNLENEVIIAPACAGVNYLIILFCMAAFQGIIGLRDLRSLPVWLCLSGVAAVGLTILVNALRIWLSVIAYRADIHAGWLSGEMVHRLLGIAVYYSFLFFHYWFISFILRTMDPMGKVSGQPLFCWVPLFWYLLIGVGVPLLGDAALLRSAPFIRHGLAVGMASVCLTLLFGRLIRMLADRSGRFAGSRGREGYKAPSMGIGDARKTDSSGG